MARPIDTMRQMFRTWDNERLRQKKIDLENELEERNVTSSSAAGISENSNRHVALLQEMEALLAVMMEKKLIDIMPSRRRGYGVVSFGINER